MTHIKTNNTRRYKKGRYEVALSFAEEDRAFVHEVAGYLRAGNVRFFYDDDKRIDSWGKDLYDYLDKIYRLDATFCVIFISKDYKKSAGQVLKGFGHRQGHFTRTKLISCPSNLTIQRLKKYRIALLICHGKDIMRNNSPRPL